MITEAIIKFFMLYPNFMLDNLGFLEKITIPDEVFSWFKNTIVLLWYVFPIKQLFPILWISVSIKGFQISYALAMKVKGFFWASD